MWVFAALLSTYTMRSAALARTHTHIFLSANAPNQIKMCNTGDSLCKHPRSNSIVCARLSLNAYTSTPALHTTATVLNTFLSIFHVVGASALLFGRQQPTIFIRQNFHINAYPKPVFPLPADSQQFGRGKRATSLVLYIHPTLVRCSTWEHILPL